MMTIARVKRNGAQNRIEMARELLTQAPEAFPLYRVSEMIQTIRHYESNGLFIVTDTEIILNHIA